MTCRLCALLLWLIAAVMPVAARTVTVCFPLRQEQGEERMQWIGAAFAERFTRALHWCAGFAPWEPVDILRSDASCQYTDNDSLLQLHSRRWMWDAAFGGSYRCQGDSIIATIDILTVSNGRLQRRQISALGSTTSASSFFDGLLLTTFKVVGYVATPEELTNIRRPIVSSDQAYALYCAGFDYELHGKPAAAVTAYRTAMDRQPKFAAAAVRAARLYTMARQFTEAEALFTQACTWPTADPYCIAAAAEFQIENTLPEKALRFIDKHRTELYQTATGQGAIGRSYLLFGEYQRAVALLTRAVSEWPAGAKTDFALGEAYYRTGQYTLATEIFNRLISVYPQRVEYYRYLGMVYRESDRVMDALAIFDAGIRIEPGNVPLLTELGATYLALHWYDRAEQALLQAHDLHPDLPSINFNLGIIYLQMGKTQKASELLSGAAAKLGERANLYTNQANVLLVGGEPVRALDLYHKAQRLGGASQDVLENSARAYLSMHKPAEASACFDEILRIAPGRVDIMAQQAALSMQLGMRVRAEQSYRGLLAADPANRSARIALLHLLGAKSRFDEKVFLCEDYLLRFPSDLHFTLELARLYVDQQWYEVGVEKYRNALRMYPEDPQALTGLGLCLLELSVSKAAGRADEAEQLLQRAAKLSPSDPLPHLYLGRVALQLRANRGVARAYLLKAQQLARLPADKESIALYLTKVD